ncbi:MAG: acyltransferase family protein [Chitinispirillaceae bacterium]
MKNVSSINAESQKSFYFKAIDGLRLLASINIVLFHLEGIGGMYDMGGTPAWFFRLVKGPAFHASIFFILGGFIFSLKFAPKISRFKTSSFIKKRLSELYPLHFLTTIMMVVLLLERRFGTESIDIPKLFFSLLMHLSFLWSFFPFGSYNLNTPSWALSAFFLCYLLFGPVLRWSMALKSRKSVSLFMILCFIPLAGWGLLFGALGNPMELYHFFHIFAPVRFFEFVLGILLARFFVLGREKAQFRFKGIRSDIVFVLLIFMIYWTLGLQTREHPTLSWFSYHVFLVPLFLTALYTLALQRGIIARFLSLRFIRQTGRTSFYPYLIHIPLISLTTMICERYFGYEKFLHSPLNIAIFMIILYGGSYFYVYNFRNKRRAAKAARKETVSQPDRPVSQKEEKSVGS